MPRGVTIPRTGATAMLTSEGCAARRKRLWESLPEECDVLVITTPESLIYFANYVPSPFVFNTVESAAALVMRPDRAILVADNLVKPFLDRSWADEVLGPEWYTAKKSAPPRRERLASAVSDLLPAGRECRLGVESIGISLEDRPRLVVVDSVIRELRRSKDPDELAVIRRSVRAGEAAHTAALEQVVPGLTELDVFLLVQRAAARELGEQVLVYGDFVSGPRIATDRGGPPTARVIERGDLFLLDFSVVVDGYRADFTNTFVVGDRPTQRQAELAEICIEAFEVGESLLRPGIAASQVDAAIRQHFASHGVDAYFPSHSGHGLGLGHPEPPYLVPGSTEQLRAGDVIALEPGLYVPEVGGMRFERNYLITPHGHELLTRHHVGLAAPGRIGKGRALASVEL